MGTFFGIAILTSTTRTAIRIHKFRRLHIDDYFLFLAVAALIGATGLLIGSTSTIYYFTASLGGQAVPPADFLQKAANIATYATIAELLSWTTIYAVKFSFLFYFRSLIKRLPRLCIWWWCVAGTFVPLAFTTIFANFILCPNVGLALGMLPVVDLLESGFGVNGIIVSCAAGHAFLHRELALFYYSVVVDILTDTMCESISFAMLDRADKPVQVISIPVLLLWQAQFDLRQRLSIGVVLSLSIIMIAIAMIRGISAHVYGMDDQPWVSFWVEVEACVSVTMVSMTAFRTLFLVSNGPKPSPEKVSPRRYLGRSPQQQAHEIPSIKVRATMTGIRTVIQHNGRSTMGSFGTDEGTLLGGSNGSERPSQVKSIGTEASVDGTSQFTHESWV